MSTLDQVSPTYLAQGGGGMEAPFTLVSTCMGLHVHKQACDCVHDAQVTLAPTQCCNANVSGEVALAATIALS